MITPEIKVQPSMVKSRREEQFIAHSNGNLVYGVGRDAFGTDGDIAYAPNLPALYKVDCGEVRRVDFSTAIQEAIDLRGAARILDVGCGEANFLRDLRRKFGKGVELVGISAFDWRDKRTGKKDKELGINYQLVDAQNLRRLGETQFDCVVSVKTIDYMADPLAVLKGIYRVLRIGGYCFLDISKNFSLHFVDDSYQCFLSFLVKQYDFQIDKGRGFAFQKIKMKPNLFLPVSYAGIFPVFPGPTGEIMMYKFRNGLTP